MKTKICSRCKLEQLISEFYKNNKRKDGLCCYCKNCYKTYQKTHKTHRKKINQKYREEHKEEMKEYQKEYSQLAKGIYNNLKGNATYRNIKFNIKKEDFINWYEKELKKCYYCNRMLEDIRQDIKEGKENKNRLSIDRKNNHKGYELDNIVLACRRCNIIKGDYFTEKEMLQLGKILYSI